MRLTTVWATRQREAPRADGQLVFGITQGAADRELRERSVEEITALGFDGYALGGLSVGEPRPETMDAVEWAAPLLPAERPRYFMGIGDPDGILDVIARGIDMFDCVLPTRIGRTGTALTSDGRLNLKNARFARDERPLDERCGCPACTRFSRAYIRHLVNQQELLGPAPRLTAQPDLPARPRPRARDRRSRPGDWHTSSRKCGSECAPRPRERRLLHPDRPHPVPRLARDRAPEPPAPGIAARR